jgi:hypothetical protein
MNTLLAAKDRAIEGSLLAAVRTLEEKHRVLVGLAEQALGRNSPS